MNGLHPCRNPSSYLAGTESKANYYQSENGVPLRSCPAFIENFEIRNTNPFFLVEMPCVVHIPRVGTPCMIVYNARFTRHASAAGADTCGVDLRVNWAAIENLRTPTEYGVLKRKYALLFVKAEQGVTFRESVSSSQLSERRLPCVGLGSSFLVSWLLMRGSA